MPLLEIRAATFTRAGRPMFGPLSLEIEEGARESRTFASPREAVVAAMLACGVAKASTGTVYVGGFDPQIQPTQCKRLAGYVPHEVATPAFASFERYVAYRAALWSLDGARALADAVALRACVGDLHEAFAYPLIGALIASPRLLVLDRPQAAYADRIIAAAGTCALFTTHTSPEQAQAFV